MEYKDAINSGFDLYEKIETEIRALARISDGYTDVLYSDGIFTIDTDHRTKDIEAKVTIARNEIIQKVLDEDLEPKEAICKLLIEKICSSACDVKRE